MTRLTSNWLSPDCPISLDELLPGHLLLICSCYLVPRAHTVFVSLVRGGLWFREIFFWYDHGRTFGLSFQSPALRS